MNLRHLLKTGTRYLVEGAAGAIALLSRQRSRERRQSQHHVERLAAEIIEVAQSIQQELAHLPPDSALVDLERRCADRVRRAEQARAARWQSIADLEEAVGRLHDGHRKIVELRSELDAHLAARRSGKELPRHCKFATGSKPVRSRWSSTTTSSHTRSTTLE